ncbi:tetratricopeptide repeat protein [Pontiella agarivorans]|uniref:Tetratricopeptide repeat protein n=1 Tax=Pontiella agarivorans TaxID=3038953 RepID=A0ABU5MWP5_9BACT|nr:tetratricopeptide repeat protein [Pontiella agarivorans]MDZ8118582.1 tetratricopeptide repeat protein [Pontiella agarivorans]
MKLKTVFLTLFITATSFPVIAEDTPSADQVSSGLMLNKQTDEERIEFLLHVAQAYFAEEDFDSAVSAYERILEIDPDHFQARYVVAHVYINAKQYGKAESLLLKLIDENPDDFKLMNNLAWLYATADDLKYRDGKKAVRYAQEALAISPDDHHVWSTLSEAHYINGDYERAYNAITTMAKKAARHGQGVTKEQVEAYNEQIRKCKRAWDTQKMLKETTK